MSQNALKWLSDIPAKKISHAEYRIMNQLCWLVDDERGYAWPSIAYLMMKTACSNRKIIDCIDRFVDLGVIRREKNDGNSTKYHFNFVNFWEDTQTAASEVSSHGCEVSSQVTSELSSHNIEHLNSKELDTSSDDDDEMEFFERVFWSRYPKKVGKKAAFKTFKKLMKDVDRGKVHYGKFMSGLDRYLKLVDGKELQYIKNPATWLNGEHWKDGE